MALPGKRTLRKLIKDTGGVVAEMAKNADVSRQTIYNWLEHYEAWDELERGRTNIVMMAETTVYEAVVTGDLDTSKWVLERRGRLRGWNKQVEISGVLSQLELSPEQLAVLEQSGLNVSDVVQQFIAMLQAVEAGE